MIPYFELTSVAVGPLRLQVWGTMVAAGILMAVAVGWREARRRGLDGGVFVDFATWIIVMAMVVARLFFAAAYDPAPFIKDPLELFRLWHGGMSSIGGFIGAFLGAAISVRTAKIRFWPYADVAAYVLPLGYAIGRIGCFLIHDHIGVRSDFFFAVAFPGGGRLDHGLLLSVFSFALFAIFFAVNRRFTSDRERGFLRIFLLAYGIVRFVLDFFRAWDLDNSDVRFLNLTPAQYGCLVMVAVGIWLTVRSRKTRPMSAKTMRKRDSDSASPIQ